MNTYTKMSATDLKFEIACLEARLHLAREAMRKISEKNLCKYEETVEPSTRREGNCWRRLTVAFNETDG